MRFFAPLFSDLPAPGMVEILVIAQVIADYADPSTEFTLSVVEQAQDKFRRRLLLSLIRYIVAIVS